jgi:hypothetical protein
VSPASARAAEVKAAEKRQAAAALARQEAETAFLAARDQLLAADTALRVAKARLELEGVPEDAREALLRQERDLTPADVAVLHAQGLLKRVSARADLSSRPGDRLSHLGWSAAAERIRGALLPRRGAQ